MKIGLSGVRNFQNLPKAPHAEEHEPCTACITAADPEVSVMGDCDRAAFEWPKAAMVERP